MSLRAGCLGLFCLLTGCSGKDAMNPGTKLGTFHVAAKLTQTTCGAVPDPWEFDVRLNHDGTMLYWIQGGAPIQGLVDTTARTQLKTEMVQEVRAADLRTKLAACSVMRSDALTVALADAEAKPASDPGRTAGFAGTLVYAFAPTEGSDCSDQTLATGGDYEALPCQISYEITGTLKTPPSTP